MSFKNIFSKKKVINASNINSLFNFDDLESCRSFLMNLYIGDSRVKAISLENGSQVQMEDIPEDQIIKRARELRDAIYGKPTLVNNQN